MLRRVTDNGPVGFRGNETVAYTRMGRLTPHGLNLCTSWGPFHCGRLSYLKEKESQHIMRVADISFWRTQVSITCCCLLFINVFFSSLWGSYYSVNRPRLTSYKKLNVFGKIKVAHLCGWLKIGKCQIDLVCLHAHMEPQIRLLRKPGNVFSCNPVTWLL